MDNQRLVLFIALSLVILLLFSAWQREQQPPPPVATESIGESAPVPSGDSTTATTPAEDVPTIASENQAAATPVVAPQSTQNTQDTVVAEGQYITVNTDRLQVTIYTAGGEIARVALPTYPVALDKPDEPFQLLDDRLPKYFVAQSGLLASQGKAPDHHALFTADKTNYVLADGEDELKVRLHWSSEDGIKVIKTFIFQRDSYAVKLDVEVQNGGQQAWKGRAYQQLQRTEMARESFFLYTYTGGVVSSSWDPYEKVEFSDMATWKAEQSYNKGGWIAMLQHYFLSAWIPPADSANHFYTKALTDGRYLLGQSGEERSIAPGNNTHFTSLFYAGPKEQHRLEKIEPNLRLTVDYGVLDILAKPVFWVMEKIYSVVGNWGLAIIFVTLIIKLIFFPLSAASYKSMANMRRLSPKLKALKERYGDDRQKMSKAMMDIYKKEKINPLGGCLPILVQIPVFIALYWVLLESVEMRQAPFALWITDLSTKDPYYVLPLLMGISMFIQQKLNPPPMDPVQQKIMQALPIIFTAFFAFFPAGLVLYWVVNNCLSIAQQWYITRKVEAQAASKA
ncbi:MAG TPA: membrane protein insertase YidC [Gammaproteobacteria bacterium]|nr:membrane protein insertase YidC [Gammaproteobacteria bacterium]